MILAEKSRSKSLTSRFFVSNEDFDHFQNYLGKRQCLQTKLKLPFLPDDLIVAQQQKIIM